MQLVSSDVTRRGRGGERAMDLDVADEMVVAGGAMSEADVGAVVYSTVHPPHRVWPPSSRRLSGSPPSLPAQRT